MTGRNQFGGKNPLSLYVPMTDVEQEFIDRIRTSGELRVTIHQWGFVDNPELIVGDSQVVIPIDITFVAPPVPIPVSTFDMELTYKGVSLFRETQSVEYGGKPLDVGAGTHLQMMWHVSIKAIDPRLIKSFMPGAVGLTSRVLDRDTGDITLRGNMHLNTENQRILHVLRQGEEAVRRDTAAVARRLAKKAPMR